jgi:hypothetical protein
MVSLRGYSCWKRDVGGADLVDHPVGGPDSHVHRRVGLLHEFHIRREIVGFERNGQRFLG